MVASSKNGSDDFSPEGIVLGHAYTFLNATYLEVEG